MEKLETTESQDFYLFKILRAHILPLTNCAFNKAGDKYFFFLPLVSSKVFTISPDL